MGQYWMPVNLSKREFVHPHALGGGLKLREQFKAWPGPGTALLILCAACPESRGSGDPDLPPGRDTGMPPTADEYMKIAARTIGRWAGDRIAIVGDYAKDTDLPPEYKASSIYTGCRRDIEIVDALRELLADASDDSNNKDAETIKDMRKRAHAIVAEGYRDISNDVCAVIEHELNGSFVGDGWRIFEQQQE